MVHLQGLRALARAMEAFPGLRWGDMLSQGQIASKAWLLETVDRLDLDLGDTLVVGGWAGLLSLALLTQMPERCGRVATLDIDVEAARAADLLLRAFVMDDLRAVSTLGDAMALEPSDLRLTRVRSDGSRVPLRLRTPRTVVNTSWEHLDAPEAWFERLPAGRLIIVQAHDDPGLEGHVSPVPSLEALTAATPFACRLFEDARALPCGRRFMTIGLT